MKEDEVTDVWLNYQNGKNFLSSKNFYEEYDRFFKFYYGNQWEGLKSGNVQPIVYPIIKPTVKYKVGVLKTYEYQVVFNANTWENREQQRQIEELCKSLNKYTNRIWELEQIKAKIDEILKDSCIAGEGIVHTYEKDGNIKAEIIDSPNIYYGNENDENIQEQPYIILSFRRTLKSVKEEAEKEGLSKEEVESICADSDFLEQAGKENRVMEISPMCLVLLKYFKKNGTVWVEKCTKNVKIKKATDTGLTLYPIAHMLWEKEKGSARGIGEVKYMIPNQIELNKTATRIAIATMLGAYPKLAYNAKYVKNIASLEKVGASIKLEEMVADDVNKVVSYLKPAYISADAKQLQADLMKNSQELAGAGDTVTGNIDPTQASGKAILAVQQASQQPLNEQLNTMKFFLEDLANIWFDMLKNYSVEGIIVTREVKDEQTGRTQEVGYRITKEQLDELKVHIKIDITPRGAYDKFAQEQSLENLLNTQKITFEEYVKALDDDSTMPKTKLDKILKDREEKQIKMQEMQIEANALQGAMQEALILRQQNGEEIQDIANKGQQVNDNAVAIMGGNTNEMRTM